MRGNLSVESSRKAVLGEKRPSHRINSLSLDPTSWRPWLHSDLRLRSHLLAAPRPLWPLEAPASACVVTPPSRRHGPTSAAPVVAHGPPAARGQTGVTETLE